MIRYGIKTKESKKAELNEKLWELLARVLGFGVLLGLFGFAALLILSVGGLF
jgi:hypothetical protein